MTYEYVCTACSHAWEAEQPISAAALKTCPNCNAETAKRQVSGGAGFILKGGGWYADLYGSTPKKTSTESSSSETKPAAKSSDASSSSGSSSSTSTSSDSSSSKSSDSSGSSGSSSSGGTKPAGTPSAA